MSYLSVNIDPFNKERRGAHERVIQKDRGVGVDTGRDRYNERETGRERDRVRERQRMRKRE